MTEERYAYLYTRLVSYLEQNHWVLDKETEEIVVFSLGVNHRIMLWKKYNMNFSRDCIARAVEILHEIKYQSTLNILLDILLS